MAAPSWDEVGRQFAELGRSLQSAWEDVWASDVKSDAAAGVKDAGERVTSAMDDLASTVHRLAGSPELHEHVRTAGTSVAEAIAASLRDVADLISTTTERAAGASSGSSSGAEDAPPEDAHGTSNGKNGTSKGDE